MLKGGSASPGGGFAAPRVAAGDQQPGWQRSAATNTLKGRGGSRLQAVTPRPAAAAPRSGAR